MAISDAQFNAWLIRSGVFRCVLVEVDAWSGGAVVTRYMSTHGFVSTPSDTPANIAYPEILQQVPIYTSVLGEILRGYSSPAAGELVIDNSNGVRDSWLLDSWDGRPFKMYLGDPSWPKSDFRLMAAGVISDIYSPSVRSLALRIRDKQHLLNKTICTTLVGGATANKDARVPVCYGECYNVEPVLTDAATRAYAVHDGQIEAITAVYEDGASKAFTANLATGTFTLSSAAAGRITADVKGSKTSGVYATTTADIASRVLQERGGLTGSDIDSASITAMNTAVPGTVGIYIKDGNTTVLQALDMLVIGAGGFYSFDRQGLFYLDQFKAPSGTPVLTLIAEDLVEGGLTIVNRWLPSKTVRVGYKKQWTVQADGLAAGVADARRAELAQPYLIAKATNSIPQHLLAEEPAVESSVFVNVSDANAEAARRAALFSSIRFLAKAVCYFGPARVKNGDVIAVNFGRFGLSGGALVRVAGVGDRLTDKQVELTLFF